MTKVWERRSHVFSPHYTPGQLVVLTLMAILLMCRCSVLEKSFLFDNILAGSRLSAFWKKPAVLFCSITDFDINHVFQYLIWNYLDKICTNDNRGKNELEDANLIVESKIWNSCPFNQQQQMFYFAFYAWSLLHAVPCQPVWVVGQ